MTEPREALALCARKDPKWGDRFIIRPDLVPSTRSCTFCGVDLWAAPSSVAMESDPGYRVVYACNPCGQNEARQRGVRKLGIAPGALPGVTPDERRRRNELEAHGFRDMENE